MLPAAVSSTGTAVATLVISVADSLGLFWQVPHAAQIAAIAPMMSPMVPMRQPAWETRAGVGVHNAREGARWHANYARMIRVAHAAYSGRAEHGSSVVDALANLGFPVLVGILAIADHADVPGILDDCDKPGGAGDEHVREDDVHEGGDDAESATDAQGGHGRAAPPCGLLCPQDAQHPAQDEDEGCDEARDDDRRVDDVENCLLYLFSRVVSIHIRRTSSSALIAAHI